MDSQDSLPRDIEVTLVFENARLTKDDGKELCIRRKFADGTMVEDTMDSKIVKQIKFSM